ncbi:phosphoribosylpyrophosphate synthetase [Fulvivirga sediminis]|uniref:Phosphoribosylpyrophosphate synthetase n=1 Tax=Fulvivirga sediminis TaxID=2803949 RepID=A0A937JXG9_9BACT|nr:phosphoribosylpyrophosphate synthetase [Fulvivirga sediminis]MBL3655463.1 phosphoribosylpyrophosphate synthetase [Fulvivirga sediminis]
MAIHNLKPMSEVMEDLKNEGYATDFNFRNNELHNDDNGKVFKPAEVTVKEEYRFEGETNPGDSNILYVIETTSGDKGILINAYGADADVDLEEFLKGAQHEDHEYKS